MPAVGAGLVHLGPDPQADPQPRLAALGPPTGSCGAALLVIAEYREAHPAAPRVGVGDLSRRHGGDFGARFGGLGHMSHQNGLDVDLYYPRRDGRERRPFRPDQVDRLLAQALVRHFARAGAEVVYVGPSLGLRGPRRRRRAARAPRRPSARAHPPPRR